MVDYRKMTLGDIISQIMFKDNIGEEMTNSLKDKILDKEQYIANIPSNTLYQGVVPSSITNKHNVYNLIEFGWPEVDVITSKVKQMVQPINFNNDDLYMKMWANVYRKGEYITKHTHAKVKNNHETLQISGYSFSGHCFLYSDIPTSTTFYFGPQEEEKDVVNTPGEIDIFSCLVPHEFKPYQGELRVGLAFDFIIGKQHYERLKNLNNYIKI